MQWDKNYEKEEENKKQNIIKILRQKKYHAILFIRTSYKLKKNAKNIKNPYKLKLKKIKTSVKQL